MKRKRKKREWEKERKERIRRKLYDLIFCELEEKMNKVEVKEKDEGKKLRKS